MSLGTFSFCFAVEDAITGNSAGKATAVDESIECTVAIIIIPVDERTAIALIDRWRHLMIHHRIVCFAISLKNQ